MTAEYPIAVPDLLEPHAPRVLRVGDLEINVAAFRVTVGKCVVALSPQEFRLLYVLARHADQVLSRRYLLDEVWGAEHTGDPGTLNVHILRLRRKVGPAASHIRTVHGIGYVFDRAHLLAPSTADQPTR